MRASGLLKLALSPHFSCEENRHLIYAGVSLSAAVRNRMQAFIRGTFPDAPVSDKTLNTVGFYATDVYLPEFRRLEVQDQGAGGSPVCEDSLPGSQLSPCSVLRRSRETAVWGVPSLGAGPTHEGSTLVTQSPPKSPPLSHGAFGFNT